MRTPGASGPHPRHGRGRRALRANLAAAAALLCLAPAGCADPQREALDFNARLNYVTDQLDGAAKEFSLHLAGAIAGDKGEAAALRKSHQKMKQTLVKVRPDLEAVKVPPKQSARDFHAAELNWVANFEKRLDDYRAIVRTVEDPALSPEEKRAKIVPIARGIDRGEPADTAVLVLAQQAFARDYKITLLPR
jgi:hypothetical protein